MVGEKKIHKGQSSVGQCFIHEMTLTKSRLRNLPASAHDDGHAYTYLPASPNLL